MTRANEHVQQGCRIQDLYTKIICEGTNGYKVSVIQDK